MEHLDELSALQGRQCTNAFFRQYDVNSFKVYICHKVCSPTIHTIVRRHVDFIELYFVSTGCDCAVYHGYV